MKIEKISIEAVRGVRQEVKLELWGKSLLVRGDNGTGKSSIVNALAWVLTGIRAKDLEESWGHVLDVGKPRVTVSFNDGSRIEVTQSATTVEGSAAAARAACQKANPFLVRKQLLAFLEQKPVERFKYLEAFLDFKLADDLYNSLTDRAREADADLKTNQAQVEKLLAIVEERLPKELRPPQNQKTWVTMSQAAVNWASAAGIRPAPQSWEELKTAAGPLKALLAGEGLARTRAAIQRSIQALGELKSESVPEAVEPLAERLAQLEAEATDVRSLAVLEQATIFFDAAGTGEACPVCEQPILFDQVKLGLRRRLDALREVQQVRVRTAASIEAWRGRGRTLGLALEVAKAALNSSGAQEAFPPLPSHVVASAEAVAASPGGDLTWASKADEQERAAKEYYEERLNTALAKLPLEAEAEVQRQVLGVVEACVERELAVALAEAACAASRKLSTDLRAVSEAVRAARQDIARELLSEISSLVGKYYERIHPADSPDEVTGEPRIEVQRRSGGTAHVRGRFNKKDVDDLRALYSDGHLDTVGICVFLALRRFRATRDGARDPHLMILDDIVLSVDLGHARRFLDLLRDEFTDHQVLMFTHNGLFFDWCIDRLVGYERVVIQRWTLETGPQLGDYLSALERIRRAIGAETSPKLLAQSVMNLMDEWLAEARFEFRLSIQARRGEEYTLTDIWLQFTKRLREAESEKSFGVWLGDSARLIGELGDLPRVRNRLAAHENEFAREFPLGVVREIATRCLQLVEGLYCTECRRFVQAVPNPDAPSIVSCSCERIRYVRPAKRAKSKQAKPAATSG